MRRREVLRALLLGLGRASTSVGEEQVPPSPGAMATLSSRERESLLAFAEVLVGHGAVLSAERDAILSHIEERVATDARALRLYRDTAALLDRHAGLPFPTLGMAERVALVARHHLVPSRGRADISSVAAHTVRTRVAPDLIAGFYRSAAGWATVGYTTFPGRCGGLTRYTRREA